MIRIGRGAGIILILCNGQHIARRRPRLKQFCHGTVISGGGPMIATRILFLISFN
jgi:hypothetical protein